MKYLAFILACFIKVFSAQRDYTSEGRRLKRSAIKLRSNTGEHSGSCSSDNCKNTQIITISAVFGIVALICAIYCISACYKEYQEE